MEIPWSKSNVYIRVCCFLQFSRAEGHISPSLSSSHFSYSAALKTMDPAEKIVLNVARGFGVVSLLSCVCVGFESLADWKSTPCGKSEIVTRIMFLLQFPLGLYALVYSILGTIPAPTSSDLWLAMGNEASCNTQAFFILLAVTIGIPLDAFKSLTYLLGIPYAWDQERLRGIELIGYAVILCYAMTLSILSLASGWFGPVYDSCFISLASECDNATDSLELCESTATGERVVLTIVLCVNMTHLAFSLYVLCRIYRFTTAIPEHLPAHFSRKVAVKGMLYAMTVSIGQVPLAFWFMFGVFGVEHVALNLATSLCLSLIGFINLLAFFVYRPQMRTSYGKVVQRLLDKTTQLLFCGMRRNEARSESAEPASTLELDPPME